MTIYQLFERYNPEPDFARYGDDDYALGQTFRIGTTGRNISFELAKIKLRMGRIGNPGILQFRIFATDYEVGELGEHPVPEGNELSTGTIDGDTLDEYPLTDWTEIDMTSVILEANTYYAWVAYAPDADGDNYFALGDVETSPSYTGGTSLYARMPPLVGQYIAYPPWDYLFEIWGIWTLDGPTSKVVTTSEDVSNASITEGEDVSNPSVTTGEDVANPSVTSSTY